MNDFGTSAIDTFVDIAYRKYKSSVYYDKTQVVARDAIVNFEKDDEQFKKSMEQLCTALDSDATTFKNYTETLLEQISVLAFPKKLKKGTSNTDDIPLNTPTLIRNQDNSSIELSNIQYMYSGPVELSILGILWILSIGKQLDDDGYINSHGNRLSQNLFADNTHELISSPYLFRPYFEQYESWRDEGISIVKNELNHNKDAVILTLDFKDFYYSLDFKRDCFDLFLLNGSEK